MVHPLITNTRIDLSYRQIATRISSEYARLSPRSYSCRCVAVHGSRLGLPLRLLLPRPCAEIQGSNHLSSRLRLSQRTLQPDIVSEAVLQRKAMPHSRSLHAASMPKRLLLSSGIVPGAAMPTRLLLPCKLEGRGMPYRNETHAANVRSRVYLRHRSA